MPRQAANLDPRGAVLLSAGAVGKHFGRDRWWGLRLLRAWWKEQQEGGPVRVLRRGDVRPVLYTTKMVLRNEAPRTGIDDALARRLTTLERDLEVAFARIAELERSIGRRR